MMCCADRAAVYLRAIVAKNIALGFDRDEIERVPRSMMWRVRLWGPCARAVDLLGDGWDSQADFQREARQAERFLSAALATTSLAALAPRFRADRPQASTRLAAISPRASLGPHWSVRRLRARPSSYSRRVELVSIMSTMQSAEPAQTCFSQRDSWPGTGSESRSRGQNIVRNLRSQLE